ncbi:MAG: methyltransferase domain-containing protein [Acidobacteria bacterium]|nr:methyltransferase domain-containing protein [Acidobacteriota bacterium]
MEFTGERVIPGQTDPDLLNEHVARYRFAEALVGGRRVADLGCGVGYGSKILAAKAAQVFALDFAPDAVAQGRTHFDAPNVRWLSGDASRLPLADDSLDVVVAFEVIEHLADWRGLLAEARRVLHRDGQLLVSTPNRPYYEESRSEPNPFHVHEFDYAEFKQELEAVFPHTTIFLENHTNAIAFTPLHTQGLRTQLEPREARPEEAHFFLAVCSDRPQFGSPAFVYLPASGNVLRDRELHIAKLERELAQKTDWLEEAKVGLRKMTELRLADQKETQAAIDRLEAEIAEKAAWAEKADQAVAEAQKQIERLEAELHERAAWVAEVEADRAKVERLRQEAQAEVEKAAGIIDVLEERVIERSKWAQSLDTEVLRLRERLQAIYASPAYKIGRRLRLAP